MIWGFSLIWLAINSFKFSFPTVFTQLKYRLENLQWKEMAFALTSVTMIAIAVLALQKYIPMKQVATPIRDQDDQQLQLSSEGWIWLSPGEKYSGTITTTQPTLNRVEAKLSNNNTPNSDVFIFKIKSLGSKNWWYQATYPMNNIYSGWFFPIGFPDLVSANSATLLWEISLPPQNTLELGVQEVVPFRLESKIEILQTVWQDMRTNFETQQDFFIGYAVIVVGVVIVLLFGSLTSIL